MPSYPKTRRIVSFVCTDLGTNALTDPTALTVEYRVDEAAITTLSYPVDNEVVHDSTGKFHILIDCPQAGEWKVRAYAAGTLVAASEASWTVLPSFF